jgi:formylglycine-generating enzyme required for sulfatase activity
MARAPAFLGLIGTASVLVWCKSFTSTPSASADGGGVGDGAGDSGGGEAGAGGSLLVGDPNTCPKGHGPAMVRFQTARGSYCIDTTEVTNAQYAEFLNRNNGGAGPTFPLPCVEKQDAVPRTPGGSTQEPDSLPPNFPVGWVDWCDAWSFCAWAGKRLCGAIGADGGAAPYAGGAAVTEREWGVACSGDGARSYPYGNDFAAGRCDDGSDVDASVPVGSRAGCVTPEGVVDLSGNVFEWENSCVDDNSKSNCILRGGSFASGIVAEDPKDVFGCDDVVNAVDRGDTAPDYGFRCCAD